MAATAGPVHMGGRPAEIALAVRCLYGQLGTAREETRFHSRILCMLFGSQVTGLATDAQGDSFVFGFEDPIFPQNGDDLLVGDLPCLATGIPQRGTGV